MSYRALDADRIEDTIRTLHSRIEERFPNRGLGRLCAELYRVAREDHERLSWVARPNRWLRLGVGVALVLGAVGLGLFIVSVTRMRVTAEFFNALQGIESAVNTVGLSAAAVWFLLNLETVWRRRAVLNDLHELRSLAHVVDMHQLTKDPTKLAASYTATASSEAQALTAIELVRYLDYCSEMLSLMGKLAALYMQNVRDPVIIEAVNDIEELTTGLARKIWQKIAMLRHLSALSAPY